MARKNRIPTATALPVKTWVVAEEAVEAGVMRGIRRFYKHRPDDAPDGLGDEIARAVMGELAERFDFGPNDK